VSSALSSANRSAPSFAAHSCGGISGRLPPPRTRHRRGDDEISCLALCGDESERTRHEEERVPVTPLADAMPSPNRGPLVAIVIAMSVMLGLVPLQVAGKRVFRERQVPMRLA
jgi:hypothetical protein